MRPPIRRTTVSAACAAAILAVASPPTQAATSKVRTCDSTVQRVTPFGQSTTVLQAATRVWARGTSCKRALGIIGSSLLQVGSAAPTPPTDCCESAWYANDADWWRKHGWRVERGIGAVPTAPGGARFVVKKGATTLRFTRWA